MAEACAPNHHVGIAANSKYDDIDEAPGSSYVCPTEPKLYRSDQHCGENSWGPEILDRAAFATVCTGSD